MVAGVAGLVAGAMSMAAGEFVSVSSQRDTERADIAKEERELAHEPEIGAPRADRRSTSAAASTRSSLARWPSASWQPIRSAHTFATSSG